MQTKPCAKWLGSLWRRGDVSRRLAANLSIGPRLFVAALLGVAFSGAMADQPPSSTDNEAFQKLRNIVAENQFVFQEMHATLPGEADFCRRFIDGLIAHDHIDVIESFHRTDDPSDPAIKPWRKCMDDSEISEGMQYYPAIGTRGFRLYTADVDNDPKNGLEDVLYSERDYKTSSGPVGMIWWDLKNCKPRGGAGAQQDDKRDANGSGWLGNNFALLVVFSGKVWALTMDSHGGARMKSWDDVWVPPSSYYLYMRSLKSKPESNGRDYSCSWSGSREAAPYVPRAVKTQ